MSCQLGINLSAAAEDGIERAVAKARDQQWVERNRGAMASYDAFVEQEGLLLGDLRTFWPAKSTNLHALKCGVCGTASGLS